MLSNIARYSHHWSLQPLTLVNFHKMLTGAWDLEKEIGRTLGIALQASIKGGHVIDNSMVQIMETN